MAGNVGTVAELVGSNEQTILPEWIDLQKKAGRRAPGLLAERDSNLHLLSEAAALWHAQPQYRAFTDPGGGAYLGCDTPA
jgi:hypothetical protein